VKTKASPLVTRCNGERKMRKKNVGIDDDDMGALRVRMKKRREKKSSMGQYTSEDDWIY
jgi:hypothetical protein